MSLQDRAAVFNRGSLCACSVTFRLDKCVRWELKRKALGPRSDSKQVTCRGRIFSCHSRSLCSDPVLVGLSVVRPFFSPFIIISVSLYSLLLSLLSLGLSICWQFSGFSVCCCDGCGFQIKGRCDRREKREKLISLISVSLRLHWLTQELKKNAIYIAFCSWLYFNNSMRWILSFWKPYTGLLRLWKYQGILKWSFLALEKFMEINYLKNNKSHVKYNNNN